MVFFPGAALFWAAFAFGLMAIWSYIQCLKDPDGPALGSARRAYFAFVLAIIGASTLLMSKLLVHDYRLAYVASYSSSDLPLHYLISTFWAGQEGSFLIWLFWGTLIGLPLARSAKEQEAPTMIVYLSTLMALVAILMKQSPFAWTPGPHAPIDGKGLNPLLQDPWMTIHPPVMFIGFASLGVPFAFAIAGLWKRRYDSWIVRSLPWVLVSFVTLGAAILMGGYWAYKTLGWGGYWGWDPVENTSLVPWIAVTALLHGMYVQQQRGRYRRLNFSLAIIAFICILYGTFLTRSGVLGDFSVHSFVDLGITAWLAAFLLVFLLLGVVMLAVRFREIPAPPVSEPFFSRGVFLLLSIACLLASGFIILLGTSAPLITRMAENPSQVAISFYNLTTGPLVLVIALLLALLPPLTWQGLAPKAVLRASLVSIGIGAGIGVLAFSLGVRHPLYLGLVTLSAIAFAASLRRYMSTAKKGFWLQSSGYLAHAGLGVMLVGIVISSAFDSSARATLDRNVPTSVLGYELTFRQTMTMPDGKEGMEVQVAKAGEDRFLAYPRMYVNTRTEQLMANPHVEHRLLYDVYLTPQQYEPPKPAQTGQEAMLAKGESTAVGGLTFALDGFDIDMDRMMEEGGGAEVGVRLDVTPAGGKTVRLVAPFRVSGSAPAIAVPGAPEGARLRVVKIDASGGRAALMFEGPKEFAGENAAVPERLAVDITIKPMINLVWGGFYLMMAGGLLALIERFRRSLAAATLPADPEPIVAEEEPTGLPVESPA